MAMEMLGMERRNELQWIRAREPEQGTSLLADSACSAARAYAGA